MEMIPYGECKNCKRNKGNCGLHFVDWNNHINYELPSEGATCFEPSEAYKKKLKEQRIKDMLEKYTAEDIELAFKKLKGDED